MSDFQNRDEKDGLAVKLWRGERMCLLGFDVEEPEPDFVGFAIECRSPKAAGFSPLRNRLAFSYSGPVAAAVNGWRNFESKGSPFQKFRWVHFPYNPTEGKYVYRVTKMHMPQDDRIIEGTSLDLDISLDPVTYDDFLDVGFTRNFASSQAFNDKFKDIQDVIIPADAGDGLTFQKADPKRGAYEWLGFEAYDLLFRFLDEAVADPSVTLDVFAYDFNEPDILARLEKMGPRLRAVIDDSVDKEGKGHGAMNSPESTAAGRLRTSSGGQVRRTHFSSLQHHKVLIARRNGKPFKALAGSTNFSFRGLYIQANNMLVFRSPEVAALFGEVFDTAYVDPAAFRTDVLAKKWYSVQAANRPAVHACFSPHSSSDLALNPVRGAIEQASSSVLYAVAFLNQIKSGPTKEAFDRLMERPVFSYGVSDKKGDLEVRKPDGSIGFVDFAYLAEKAPEPFSTEWSAGRGINIHHKFVVTDFSLPSAKVFVGSSNLSPTGEQGNGDHLLMIEDQKVATSYAIEALRVFDHLHFRSRMKEALGKKPKKSVKPLTLAKPTAISDAPAWFEEYFVPGSQKETDRKLFST